MKTDIELLEESYETAKSVMLSNTLIEVEDGEVDPNVMMQRLAAMQGAYLVLKARLEPGK